ncbi:MAG: universal stress protein [Geminicoccaceae bacterium]
MSEADAASGKSGGTPVLDERRTFLVIVDDTDEMQAALRFACRRAQRTGGRVALLYIVAPLESEPWLGVGRKMAEERRQEAEQVLQRLAADVVALSGSMPALFVRDGRARDVVLKLLDEEPSISVLVLGTARGSTDPGPLVSRLLGTLGNDLRVPVTLVPGHLEAAAIDALT